jgi:molecular chaperone DnaK
MKKKTNEKEAVIGIDLGTTTTQFSKMNKSGIVQILSNMDGDIVTPSIVSVAGEKPIVGKVAKQDRFFAPEMVAGQFKRSMASVTETGDPFPVLTTEDGTEFTAIMLAAELLRYIKDSAEKQTGLSVKMAVISVPAYFQLQARQATKEAGMIAGFKRVHIIDEPTAAATFYGLTKGEDMKIAVFDFGGGTFDISILDIKSDGKITPLGIDGDPECGGCNVDEAIFRHVRDIFEEKGKKLDRKEDMTQWIETLDSCKQAKEALAHKDSAIVPIKIGDQRLSMEVTSEQLKEWSADIIKILTNCCKRAMEKADLKPSQIDKVLLVGGSTRLKFVSEIVEDIFKKTPVTDTDPDMAVAKGNAILAAAYSTEPDSELLIEGERFLAGSVLPIPIAGRDLCVAAITKRSKGDINEYNVAIIKSGEKLPYKAVETFSPADHKQPIVAVKLIDGRPGELSDNFTPLQEVQVEVQPAEEKDNDGRIEFKIKMDTEGMVDIKVRDKLLNKPVPINFKFHTGLSDDEIKKQHKQLVARHNS